MFNAMSAVKLVVSGVVGVGTGKIVAKIIKNNVSPETLIDKVTVTSAAWVLSGIVTTATKKYTNEMIDDGSKLITQAYNDFQLRAKLGRINRFESTWENEGLDPANFKKNENDKWEAIKLPPMLQDDEPANN